MHIRTLLPLGLALGGLATPSLAHAFCGTYVGQPGDALYSGASEVVLAREGRRTILTMRNDIEGDVTEFAMLIPVPEVLSEDDVRVVPRTVLDSVREYAGPRLVSYACSDFAPRSGGYGRSGGCSGIGCTEQSFTEHREMLSPVGGGPPSLDVTVEAEFAAGEYDIVILSSEDSADLLTWLDREGYGVSADTESLLTEYIEADSKFMAAKVRLADVPVVDDLAGRPYLTPLQIAYESETASLPIRLGTVNSPGSQDLIVYTLTSATEGEMAIANYPATEIETDCLYDEAVDGSLETFLSTRMDAAVEANDGVAWATTYSWSPGKCDPCPPNGALEDGIVRELGLRDGGSNAHLTRLWMRYDADAVNQDVSFYATNRGNAMQLRYIQYTPGLEAYFPVCGEGWVDDYEACPTEDDEVQEGAVAPWWLGLGFIGALAGLGALLRRRR